MIGTKPLEDESFAQANEVLKITSSCMLVFFIMEVVMYFLYHYKVNQNSSKLIVGQLWIHFCSVILGKGFSKQTKR